MNRKNENRIIVSVSLVVFALVFAFISLTLTDPGLAWDESNDIRMAAGAEGWFGALRAGGGSAWNRDSIEHFWEYEWKQHPAVSRIIYAAGHSIAARFSDDPVYVRWYSYRYTSAALFAFLAALVFATGFRYLGGVIPGVTSAAALVLMPRMFGHAHIVETDLVLCVFVFLTSIVFLRGLDNRRWSILFGVLVGLLPAIKFTGAFLPVPLFAYALLFRRKDMWWNFAAVIIAPFVFYLVQPMYWLGPVSALTEYLTHFLSPGAQSSIVVHFSGADYPKSPPATYPWFMTAAVIPPVTLVAAIAGFSAAIVKVRKNSTMLFFAINAVFFLALFSPSRVAVYDGERLFMAVFPFWALLAGAGVYWLKERAGNIAAVVAVAVLVASAVPSLTASRPYYLTYYNFLVGGSSGASEKGHEVMYWGEAFTPGLAMQLNEKLPHGARITTIGYYHGNLGFFQQIGLLRKDFKFEVYGSGRADFLLLFNRRGVLDPLSRVLLDETPPFKDIVVMHRGQKVAAVYILKSGLRFYGKMPAGNQSQ